MQKKLPETVLDPSKYTVGWICAVRLEFTVARLCLDKEHSDLKFTRKGDNNTYQLGEIGDHNVVIACCPVGGYGICNATAVVKDMVATFPNVRFCLMVGIGGGAPSPKADIRLGDVVAGVPQNDANGGVFQYDFGKARQGQAFEHTGYLNKPPRVLLTAINKLESEWELAKEGNGIGTFIDAIINNPDRNDKFRAKYGRPSTSSDVLYVSDFLHPSEAAKSGSPCIEVCGSDPETLVLRQPRKETNDPVIHYGLIASGNQVVKDALLRDELVAAKNVLCFEMEAAGLMDNLPCLAVRGICDYSDSHKNNQWQGYSAMCAAAYASKLLHFVAAEAVEGTLKVVEVIQNSCE
ncbi:purine and uridine phosphorylase [Ascobolus immersus RN42]|uniref:Purine and uridine phosphorylase n=1 Tax=Ascobolus immersus RN42 TaxID=1160509 RepID=A0A3N4HXI7_ASCIM|nr:purine and uridine phosphorylase [Ascobolus immersus RN42]